MIRSIPGNVLCTLITSIAFCPSVIAKGPPPHLWITLDSADTATMIFNSADEDEMDLYDGFPIGTVLLEEAETVTIHIAWTYAMQTVSVMGQDSTLYSASNWSGFSSSFSVGPVGELSVSAWGMEWGYDLHFVLATPDPDAHPVLVQPYVLLGGAFREDGPYLMGTELCTNGMLPLTEPYSAMGWLPSGSGGETTTPDVLAPQTYASNNVVDWVLLELRDALDPSIVVANKCGLLHANGMVTAEDGNSPVSFMAPYGSYYLAVRHRNHLGAMTALPFNSMSLPTPVYMGSPGQVMNGESALIQSGFSSQFGLCPGNGASGTGHQRIKYTGSNNDRDVIFVRLGGSVPTSTASGYYKEDLNLDGIVKYVGSHSDADVILTTNGGLPNTVREEQLP